MPKSYEFTDYTPEDLWIAVSFFAFTRCDMALLTATTVIRMLARMTTPSTMTIIRLMRDTILRKRGIDITINICMF